MRELVDLGDPRLACDTAVRTGWIAARVALRRLGVGSAADLRSWFAGQGFVGVQEGGYFNGKAQECLLDRCAAVDARVPFLEAAG